MAMPIDMETLSSVSFLACSVHKWLLGPYGLSLVYIHESLYSNWQPLDQHERSRVGSHASAWDEVNPFQLPSQGYPEAFEPGARRLDGGGRPNPIVIPMLIRSLELLLSWGVDRVSQQLRCLTSHLRATLCNRPIHRHLLLVPSEHASSHILSLRLLDGADGDWSSIASQLESAGVSVSLRAGWLRIAPYLFTSLGHLHIFEALLTQLLYRQLVPKKIAPPQHRVLVIGGGSWFAQFLTAQLLSDPATEVHVTSSRLQPLQWMLPDRCHHLDLLEQSVTESFRERVAALLRRVRPTAIVHLSALSSPVQCDKDPDTAYLVNCPELFAEIVREEYPRCCYIFASTDMVFDGEHAPYALAANPPIPDTGDTSRIPPVNVYGKTKKAYEEKLWALREGLEVHLLRFSNLLGPAYYYKARDGGKFLEFLYRSMQQRKVVGLRDYEIRSFVAVEDVVRVIEDLIRRPRVREQDSCAERGGVWHIGGPKGLSRLELAQAVGKAMGIPVVVDGEDREALDESCTVQPWRVERMKDAGPSTGVQSPRDITMETQSTEEALGWRFHSVEEVLPAQLLLMQRMTVPFSSSP